MAEEPEASVDPGESVVSDLGESAVSESAASVEAALGPAGWRAWHR